MKYLDLLKSLTEVSGVSGYEKEVRELLKKELNGIAVTESDNIGSIIFKLTGKKDYPRIMIAGHMDEVGMMVTMITDKGFLKFQTLGGWWEQVMLSQPVIVKSAKGDVVGLIGSKPPHILTAEERKKVVDKQEMFIDIGAISKEEVEEIGIRPGDPVVPLSQFIPLANPKMLMAKAWDDRIGCAVFTAVLKEIAKKLTPNTVFGVGTVQEEVGLRGAQTAVEVVKPDIGIVVDVSIAGDVPGVKEEQAQGKLGKGPAIIVYDATMIFNTKLRDLVVNTAKEEGIPFQYDSLSGGGTDAGKIHLYGKGVPSLVIGIPTRYIHSHYGIIHYDDFYNTVKLITALLFKLDMDTVESIKRG
jgi:endoglucanase